MKGIFVNFLFKHDEINQKTPKIINKCNISLNSPVLIIVDNDNTNMSITLVVIRHALVMEMMVGCIIIPKSH